MLIQVFKARWIRLDLVKSAEDFYALLSPLQSFLELEDQGRITFEAFSSIVKFLISVQGYLSEANIIYEDLYGHSSGYGKVVLKVL